jgi:hypothetical protein
MNAIRELPDLLKPPPYRFDLPIVDAHCHLSQRRPTDRMLKAGKLYGVHKWIGIARLDEIKPMRRRWGSRVEFSVWTDHNEAQSDQSLVDNNSRIVEQAVAAGAVCFKFWYKPEFNERSGLYFDDPRLDPVFQAIVDADKPVLVHIADPDIWWTHRYVDDKRFEKKHATYRQLTNTLSRFRTLRVMAAHMGGWPENLPLLDQLLNQYPNLYLDTSGTKWIARELSHQASAARGFFIRHADRLLFGSDLVAFKQASVEHHCSRYWVHRHLYEYDQPRLSPIHDPDARSPVFVAGLNLPTPVLEKLYLHNAVRLFGLNDL